MKKLKYKSSGLKQNSLNINIVWIRQFYSLIPLLIKGHSWILFVVLDVIFTVNVYSFYCWPSTMCGVLLLSKINTNWTYNLTYISVIFRYILLFTYPSLLGIWDQTCFYLFYLQLVLNSLLLLCTYWILVCQTVNKSFFNKSFKIFALFWCWSDCYCIWIEILCLLVLIF